MKNGRDFVARLLVRRLRFMSWSDVDSQLSALDHQISGSF